MFLSNFSQKPEYFSERSKDVFAENFSNFLFPFLHTCLCPTFHIERLLNIRLVRHKLRKMLNVVMNTIFGFYNFPFLANFQISCSSFDLSPICPHCLPLLVSVRSLFFFFGYKLDLLERVMVYRLLERSSVI